THRHRPDLALACLTSVEGNSRPVRRRARVTDIAGRHGQRLFVALLIHQDERTSNVGGTRLHIVERAIAGERQIHGSADANDDVTENRLWLTDRLKGFSVET